ncbi:hypothetical protein K402DRAFT_423198 [Aulographum hederae CBS 113979]|uniref:F-box domain-containing protein n=1 Tax=Aulographum hederae CBS 113979 TaxID=1176131 RepID=A0A6G1GT42_9PEZI|nr:hypothetical protein K402DRAFT_423198 [Aulographum hederae CBS 113979]
MGDIPDGISAIVDSARDILSPRPSPLKRRASWATPLEELPDELLDQIASHVETTRDLRNLALTSKRWRQAAEQYLYHHFDHTLYTNPRRLHGFIRNLINHPKLAQLVKQAHLQDQQRCASFWDMSSWHIWAQTNYDATLSHEDCQLFLQAAQEVGLQTDHDQLGNLVDQEEAQLALLLSRTINLEELALTIPATHSNRLLLQRLRVMIDLATGLQKLTTFVPTYYNFEGHIEGGFELAPISSIFRLPSIRTIRGTACLEPEDDAFNETAFDCPKGTSTVTEIDFMRSSICPKAFKVMIEACSALEVLHCDWGGHTVGWSEINFAIIGHALLTQKHSLRRLTLDCRKHYDIWPEADEVLIAPLGLLHDFPHLAYVDVPGVALIGWDKDRIDSYRPLGDTLPTAIEELRISNWAPHLVEQLRSMARSSGREYKRLRRLKVLKVEGLELDEMQMLFRDGGSYVEIELEDASELDHFS